jgi:hypothetical protein
VKILVAILSSLLVNQYCGFAINIKKIGVKEVRPFVLTEEARTVGCFFEKKKAWGKKQINTRDVLDYNKFLDADRTKVGYDRPP